MEEWTAELDVSELPEPYQTIARHIGIRNALWLAEAFGGTTLYLPKLDSLWRRKRNERIRREFRGDFRELAAKYGLTETWVRKIVSGEGEGEDDRPHQRRLFEGD